MKKYLLIIGILFVIGLIFTAGVFVGLTNSFAKKAYSVNALEAATAKASTIQLHIDQINEQKYRELIDSLNLELDIQILSIDLLTEKTSPSQADRLSFRILSYISNQRDKYQYTSSKSDIHTKISKILSESVILKKKYPLDQN
jgi:hypothetical protein